MDKKITSLFFVFILLSLITLSPPVEIFAQSPKIPYKQLGWSNFQGTPGVWPENYKGEKSDFSAFTWTNLSGNWKFKKIDSGSCRYEITQVDGTASFYPTDSWVKEDAKNSKNNQYLLNHEQRHLDITEIQARGFEHDLLGKTFSCPDGVFDSEKINKITVQIFQTYVDGMTDMNALYDDETGHSTNKNKQEDWNLKIDCMLQNNGPTNYCLSLTSDEEQEIQVPQPIEPIPPKAEPIPAPSEKITGNLVLNDNSFTVSRTHTSQVTVSGEVESYERGTPFVLTITYPDGTQKTQGTVVTRNGDFQSILLTLDHNSQQGTYSVKGYYGNERFNSVSFTVTTKPPLSQSTVQLPKSLQSFQTFTSDEYEFSIDYPNNWFVNDQIYHDENWVGIVSFSPTLEGDAFFGVSIIDDTYRITGLSGNQYLNDLIQEEKQSCASLSIQEDGLSCSDFELIQSDILTEDGLSAYAIAFYYSTLDSVGVMEDRIYLETEIPINNQAWQFVYDSSLEEWDLYSELYAEMIGSMNIFELEQESTLPTDTFTTYESNYGFSINYPSDWYVDDEVIQDENYFTYVWFTPEFNNYDTQISVSKYENDLDYRGLNTKQYIDKLDDDYQSKCNEATLDTDGYTCKNFSLLDKGSTITNKGQTMYYIVYFQDETYSDGSTFNAASARYEILDNADTWEIGLFTAKDDLLNMPQEILENAITSFSVTKKPSTMSQPKSDKGGCLIATATYGSELAPQVQQLRELRDNSLLQTESGISFMETFNDFYYSFSPIIADYERENPLFKEMVKITITPMISSLSILNYVDMDSEIEVLGYGISLILLNVGMYFVTPAIVIVMFRKFFFNKLSTDEHG
ncbi:CFI-box-CTERM domain-containing protein [Nitrosopumilus ureiphilus]|uniref:CFI-box-CTERM domain-containing protein n=1 Tax=Nitrosopumilus ureiphilus TaxID=1470067 RepID=UPI001FE5DA3B|nr:CFI-box-CTERM domain-containing protein [Nitrosopumilus ureiphilus]